MRSLLLLGLLGCGGSSTGPGSSGPALSISFTQSSVSQGGTVGFTITLPSGALQGGIPLVFTFSGIATGADTAVLPVDTAGAPLEGTLGIPSGAPDGNLTLTVSLPTLNQTSTASLTIQDTQLPTVSVYSVDNALGGLSWDALPGYGAQVLFIAGTPDTITITAADNHQLAWVGWSLSPGSLADSVPANGSAGTATFVLRVPTSQVGTGQVLTVFATDADGNRATSQQTGVTVSSLTTHPSQSVPRGARINDVAFDSARGVVYLAKPDSLTVSVLALGSMTYQTGITFSATPTAVDLTPTGDSLIVGLASPSAIAIVDLTSPAHPILSTIPLTATGATDTLTSLRISADSRVIAYTSNGYQQQSIVVEINLATGVQTAIVTAGANACDVRPMRSGDRTHVLLRNCPESSTLYTSTTQTYTSLAYNADGGAGGNLFTSASGSAPYVYQFEHVMTDSTWAQLEVGGISNDYGAVVAPNGTDFYSAAGECAGGSDCADTVTGLFFHYVLGQSGPAEIITDPHPAYELAIAPGGATLLGLTADTIVAMDLTHSTPATASQIARFKTLMRRSPHSARSERAAPPSAPTTRFVVRLAGRLLPPISLGPRSESVRRPQPGWWR